jgi:hypothetical protein
MATFEKIATVEVGSGGSTSINFTVIPSTFTDLCIKYSIRDTQTGGNSYSNIYLTFNGNTSNYSERLLYGLGSGTPGSVNRSSQAELNWLYATTGVATASTFANGEIYIPNYAGSNNKSISMDSVTENNATEAIAAMTAGLWSNTSAINQITLTKSGTTFAQYSTATLYGIKKA